MPHSGAVTESEELSDEQVGVPQAARRRPSRGVAPTRGGGDSSGVGSRQEFPLALPNAPSIDDSAQYAHMPIRVVQSAADASMRHNGAGDRAGHRVTWDASAWLFPSPPRARCGSLSRTRTHHVVRRLRCLRPIRIGRGYLARQRDIGMGSAASFLRMLGEGAYQETADDTDTRRRDRCDCG